MDEIQHPKLLEYARRIPKVELHVHFEGAIRPKTLLELAKRNGIKLPVSNEDDIQQFYTFRDFGHFVDVYVTVTSCLHTADDYRLVAYEFGADRARQNIRYSEATFTITTNVAKTGLPYHTILDALNAGREQARQEFGVDWRWIFDIIRDHPETQLLTLEMALGGRDGGVVALGLGGSEAQFPPELFIDTFERAYQAGLHCIPHSGETAGPASIWTSLRSLHAERLGHGVRCIEDQLLVDTLRQRQVPLEVCPTSNVRLGIYPDYAHHPFPVLWDAGLFLTINSDDPPMFGTDLINEYQVLVNDYRFTEKDLEKISLNAVRASFLPENEKARLEQDFRAEFQKLTKDIGESTKDTKVH